MGDAWGGRRDKGCGRLYRSWYLCRPEGRLEAVVGLGRVLCWGGFEVVEDRFGLDLGTCFDVEGMAVEVEPVGIEVVVGRSAVFEFDPALEVVDY